MRGAMSTKTDTFGSAPFSEPRRKEGKEGRLREGQMLEKGRIGLRVDGWRVRTEGRIGEIMDRD